MKIKDVRPQPYVKQLRCDRCGQEAEDGDSEFYEFTSIEYKVNRPGFRGGCLVKVKPGFRSSRRVAGSSLPQPRPVEYTQSVPAVGGG